MQKVPEHEYPVPSIPEYDYPAPFPLEVKNTFLDVKALRAAAAPGSFLEFYNDRQIRSAPGSKVEPVEEAITAARCHDLPKWEAMAEVLSPPMPTHAFLCTSTLWLRKMSNC
eukprot:3878821-Amphidinium_carterae.2